MRIDFTTLEKIQKFYGSNDFEIGAALDYKGRPILTLRFGYWEAVDEVMLNKLLPSDMKLVRHSDWDGDTGPIVSYSIIDKFLK